MARPAAPCAGRRVDPDRRRPVAACADGRSAGLVPGVERAIAGDQPADYRPDGAGTRPVCRSLALANPPRTVLAEPVKKITTRFALLMAAAAVLPLLAYGAVSIVSLR